MREEPLLDHKGVVSQEEAVSYERGTPVGP
jgi:hypothetical protein